MSYGDLTDTEQHYWDEYGTIRALSDWEGYTEGMENRKTAARSWLVAQRNFIKSCAEGKETPEYKPGWNIHNRKARYEQLSDENLNSAVHKHEYTLPANGSTPREKAYIEEREGYLMIGGDGKSADEEQSDRKTQNSDFLVARRKKLFSLIKSSSDAENRSNHRSERYKNLSIATHHGKAWKAYEKTHNKYGQPLPTPSGDRRQKCVDHAKKYLGVNERPSGSNQGKPQPSKWQERTIGYSGVPWCACFAVCMAWDSGCKGSGSAAVINNINMAKRGQGIYRGWTTNPGSVLKGDHVAIGCSTCHEGIVAETPGAGATQIKTIEGNTSPGSEGSQFNGGCVASRTRSMSEIVGFMLVDFPG